ncbi:hypothetical protein Tco_1203590 [Tanacetum coccineum]
MNQFLPRATVSVDTDEAMNGVISGKDVDCCSFHDDWLVERKFSIHGTQFGPKGDTVTFSSLIQSGLCVGSGIVLLMFYCRQIYFITTFHLSPLGAAASVPLSVRSESVVDEDSWITFSDVSSLGSLGVVSDTGSLIVTPPTGGQLADHCIKWDDGDLARVLIPFHVSISTFTFTFSLFLMRVQNHLLSQFKIRIITFFLRSYSFELHLHSSTTGYYNSRITRTSDGYYYALPSIALSPLGKPIIREMEGGGVKVCFCGPSDYRGG